jgi:NADPH2:quinone reductase
MKAVQFTAHGDRDVIAYDDHPDPEPARDEILVELPL